MQLGAHTTSLIRPTDFHPARGVRCGNGTSTSVPEEHGPIFEHLSRISNCPPARVFDLNIRPHSISCVLYEPLLFFSVAFFTVNRLFRFAFIVGVDRIDSIKNFWSPGLINYEIQFGCIEYRNRAVINEEE